MADESDDSPRSSRRTLRPGRDTANRRIADRPSRAWRRRGTGRQGLRGLWQLRRSPVAWGITIGAASLLLALVSWLRPLPPPGPKSLSLVALTTGLGPKPVSGLQFTFNGRLSAATDVAGATRLRLPESLQAGRQIEIDLADSAEARRGHWFLVNRRINVPSGGESAALVIMDRREIREIAGEVSTRAAQDAPQPGESAAEGQERSLAYVAAHHGLTSEQLHQAVQSFAITHDPEDRAIALYLEAKFASAEALLKQIVAGKAHDLADAYRFLGAAQFAQAKFQEAADTYRRAQVLAPGDTDILDQLGSTLFALADWSGAERLWRQARDLDKASGSPHLTEDLNDLAQVLQETNRLAEAEALMRQALALDTNRRGPDDPDLAAELSNLAALLDATDRQRDAEPLLRRALAIDLKHYGPDHPEVATDRSNLAELLRTTNRMAEAETLMTQALATDRKTLRPDHPNLSRDLNNLALVLVTTARLTEAEPLLREALAIDEKSLARDHPEVAVRLHNLGEVLLETDRPAAAEPLLRRALAIDEKNYGPNHPNVASDLTLLARLLRGTGRLAAAEPLFDRALHIDQQSHGAESTDVAIDLDDLALLRQAQGRLAEAEDLMRRALAIDNKRLGSDNPRLALDLNDLAQLLRARRRPAEAEPLLRQAVGILFVSERANGHQHTKMASVVRNYRSLLSDLGSPPAQADATIDRLRHTAPSAASDPGTGTPSSRR